MEDPTLRLVVLNGDFVILKKERLATIFVNGCNIFKCQLRSCKATASSSLSLASNKTHTSPIYRSDSPDSRCLPSA